MANVVIPSVNSIPQGEPREGRLSLELGENGKAGLLFATGVEVFQWNSNALQSGQRLSAILSAWIDNTAMPLPASDTDPPNFLTVQIGRQTFLIPAGVQTYILCAPYMPTTVTVSANIEGPYGVQVILYNYNVNFTGANFAGAQPVLAAQAGGPPPIVGGGDANVLSGGSLGGGSFNPFGGHHGPG